MTPSTPPEPSPTPSGLPVGTRLLLTGACAVILIAGLRAASSLLIPILLAGLLSLVCYLPMRAMQRRGVPRWLAVVLVIVVASLSVFAIVAIGQAAIERFAAAVPELNTQLKAEITGFSKSLQERQLIKPEQAEKMESLVDPSRILGLITGVTSAFFAALSNLFVIVLLMAFMLVEAHDVGGKVRRAFGGSAAVVGQCRAIKDSIASYLTIKSAVSLLTGVLVALLTWAMDTGFPVLWGILAFLFNFIPNIGSIIAAVPAVAVALIRHGPGTATAVAAGYVAVNLVVGNVIEPRVMGQRLGLSTLVVFISLLFWSWVWGPVGMLLSVPLTVALKIIMEQIDDLRPIAILLGPAEAGDDDTAPA